MQRFLAFLAVATISSACGFDPPPAAGDAGGDAAGNLPVISFALPTTTVDEDVPVAMVEVELSEAVGTTVSATLSVTGGTATSPDDFTLPADTVAFSPGETSKQYPVNIVKDLDDNEMLETVEISISAPQGATIDAQNSTHTISISNVALPRVQFAAATSSTPEETPTDLQVVLDKPSIGESTVVVNVTGGTPGGDYAFVDGTVITIPDGATMASVPIGEIDDTLDEPDEDVVFSFGVTSNNLVVGAIASSTHTILDNDDQPTVQFSLASATVPENIGTVTLEVALSTASGRDITVDFARDAASSAADPADATVVGAPGTLTFLAGQTSKTITVNVVDDALDENPEDVKIALANATNATLGTNASHTLTITDDDPLPNISFAVATTTTNEIATTLNIVVALSTASGRNVNVPYTVTGTAGAADFTDLTGSPIQIPAGATQATIQIQIAADTLDEDNETVILTLGTVTNATKVAPSSHTITINDDDDPPVVNFDAAQGNRSINEGNTGSPSFSYDLVLSASSGRTVSVNLVFTGDATIPGDYSVTGVPVVFAPGETRKAFTYTIVTDTVNEPGSSDTIIMTIDPATTVNATVGNDDERQHEILDDD